MPSAPRSGDGIASTVTRPWAGEPVADLAEHGPVHLGVAHDAAVADPAASRFELRLHEQHEIGRASVLHARARARP